MIKQIQFNEGYVFKTDREEQWEKIEIGKKENGNTKKDIQEFKDFYFNGPNIDFKVSTSQLTGCLHRLGLHPDRTIHGWQNFIDKYWAIYSFASDIFILYEISYKLI